MSIIYLVKESNDLVSFCQCHQGIVGSPGQVSCPWCGCGWLFPCVSCHKAFTFAKAVELDTTWERLAVIDLFGCCQLMPDDQSIAEWVAQMKRMTAHLKLGQSYIYLDGCYIPKDAKNFTLEGLQTTHHFSQVPQVSALKRPEFLKQILSNRDYWLDNDLAKRDLH